MTVSESPLRITGFCKLTSTQLVTKTGVQFKNIETIPNGDWLKHLYKELNIAYPKFHKMDILCKSAFLATEWLSQETPFKNKNTPLIFANQTGSMTSDAKHIHNIQTLGISGASPANFVYTLPNIAMGEISIRHQLHSKNVFFIFDQFADENWLSYIELSFHEKNEHQILAGWIEATEENLDVLIFMVEPSDIGLRFTQAELNTIKFNL